MRRSSRDETCPGSRAGGDGTEGKIENQTFTGNSIEGGRLYRRIAQRPCMRPGPVVSHRKKDVGEGWRLGSSGEDSEAQKGDEDANHHTMRIEARPKRVNSILA